MLTLKRLAWLKAGAPPRNVTEAALSAKLGGGGTGYEKTVGPSAIVSVTDAKRKPAVSLVASLEPIQEGSGDPSPDNVRPITGHTGLTAWNDPVQAGTIVWNQLINPSTTGSTTVNGVTFTSDGNGSIEVSGTASATASLAVTASYPTYVEGHKYYICGCPTGGANNKYSLRYNSNGFGENGSGAIVTAVTGSAANGQIKVGTQYPGVVVANGTAISGTITFRPQIFDLTEMFGAGNEPSTVGEFRALFPHDYYAYDSGTQTCVSAVNGDPYGVYPVSWQDEAGTVYGGTVDIVTGVLTVTHTIYTFTGEEGWSKQSGKEKYYSSSPNSGYLVSNGKAPEDNFKSVPIITSIGDYDLAYNSLETEDYGICIAADKRIGITSSLYGKMTGVQICYELATHLMYQLDPHTVQMLKGTNNLWNDAGDSTLTYVGTEEGE